MKSCEACQFLVWDHPQGPWGNRKVVCQRSMQPALPIHETKWSFNSSVLPRCKMYVREDLATQRASHPVPPERTTERVVELTRRIVVARINDTMSPEYTPPWPLSTAETSTHS